MMKVLLSIGLIAALALPVCAASLKEGSYELSAGGFYDIADTEDNAHLGIAGSLGCYVADGFLFGACVGYERKAWESYFGADELWSLGLFAEYNFVKEGSLIPYIRGSVEALNAETAEDMVTVWTAGAGVKLFLTDTLALFAQVNWQSASEDIYDFERVVPPLDEVIGEGSSSDVYALVGIRILLK